MMPGEELIVVADSGPAAFSEPFGKAPEPLYELPLGPHTEHMAKGVAAALRSLMRSCADPDGWLPILLDEQRCATISRRAPVLSLLPARRVCSSLRAHLLRAGTGAPGDGDGPALASQHERAPVPARRR